MAGNILTINEIQIIKGELRTIQGEYKSIIIGALSDNGASVTEMLIVADILDRIAATQTSIDFSDHLIQTHPDNN